MKVKQMFLNNQQITEKIKKEIKMCIEKNKKWEHDTPKLMGHCKSSAKRKVDSNTGLPQETRETSKEQPNHTKNNRKKKNKNIPKVVEGKKS